MRGAESVKGPYFYGNAAPVLKPKPQTELKRAQVKKQIVTKNVSVSRRPETQTSAIPALGVVKFFVACVFVFALIGFLNITFTSMAVASSTQAEEISDQISEERETGKTLEVEYGTLSNPASVKEKAAALGMETASELMQINVPADPVQTKDDGSIDLCSTLKAAANQS